MQTLNNLAQKLNGIVSIQSKLPSSPLSAPAQGIAVRETTPYNLQQPHHNTGVSNARTSSKQPYTNVGSTQSILFAHAHTRMSNNEVRFHRNFFSVHTVLVCSIST